MAAQGSDRYIEVQDLCAIQKNLNALRNQQQNMSLAMSPGERLG